MSNLPTRRTYRSVAALAFLAFFSLVLVYSKVLASNVTATWSYDFDRDPACSSSRAVDCIDHFEVLDITNQRSFSVIQNVANPLYPQGKMDHLTTSFKYGPPFGQRTISLIAVGKDKNGTRVTSNPFAARVTVTIQPISKASVTF